mmetsp:Transcript_119905/g.339889  ORF Transcript_119905/g.339889 Transcript_119905/m.339889 type:complete len:383 (-) Transcript_119905:71-1219(-)|eukprot:CAMPEP_0179314038 /NCGR_PEP_ID=MMETSP0797-20121207/54169_1 /TAXON_ID=47934 /ORGANISM="Dinophysis acuminata, Strain DAEP01" /LENGTH=382 /DNA_ID=CAMNT_0021024177 /DNA_START=39 /DNA_END=1187 /DNA_ORIENTATION=+
MSVESAPQCPPTKNACGAKLAAFAMGCLGVESPIKAGGKLGLMGNVSEEEFDHVLRHLETLARQRAAKLAGAGPDAAAHSGSCCSASFLSALCGACGDPGASVDAIFARLPHDDKGRAALLRVFGMDAALAPEGAHGDDDFPADFAESASALPHVSAPVYLEAERHLGGTDPTKESWTVDTRALNKIRAALAHKSFKPEDTPEKPPPALTAALIEGAARRCGSQRPALAKSALQALQEFAACDACSADDFNTWPSAAEAVFSGCLSAFRGTKVVARLAEATMPLVCRRIAREASPSAAVSALAACVAREVVAPTPQPPVVAAGLRALAPLASDLCSDDKGAVAATEAAVSLCESILANRKFSPAFSEARAIQRKLCKELDPP